jgi:tetratricopeptide (TPR) repeat protein
MKKALTTAAGSFAADGKNPRTIIYIGDGRSTAKYLTAQESDELISKLTENRISIDSYLIGARTDAQIAGALAGQTGGVVVNDTAEITAPQAAAALNAAIRSPVLWPQSVTWPEGLAEVFPKHTPPLRADRDTVLIGTFKGAGPFDIQYAVETPGGAEKLSASVKPGMSDDANNYLMQLVEYARQNGGATLPLAGTASLEQLRAAALAGAMSIKTLAGQALASGNLENAEKLIDEALRQDPNDPEASSLKGALAKKRQGGASAGGQVVIARQPAAGGGEELSLVGPGAVVNDKEVGALAEGFQQERKIIAQVVQTEVVNTINQARKLMSSDPDTASTELNLMLQNVRQAADLNPDVRDQLSDQLRTALREAARMKVEVEFRRQQQQESMAAARERQLITDNLLHNQQKLKQLMDRFDSLMNEGKYLSAEEDVAAEAVKIDPNSPVPLQAELFARTTGYYQEQMKIKLDKEKGFVDTMNLVDKSSIPFPDDPPIVYIDAEKWQQLTARRKDKYSSMDLAKVSPTEKKLKEALKSETSLDFVEQPLSVIIDYLKDFHKIQIQLDRKALEGGAVTSETPVTVNLKGIPLKSALRRMLRDLDLTFVIKKEDEDAWIVITTKEEADTNTDYFWNKAYPVADLVVPIQSNSMGGMGMMGGMGGGMMGGMGGGGMGGMSGGGMGGMGGGGMFNVGRDLLPSNIQQQLQQRIQSGNFHVYAVKDHIPAPGNAKAAPSADTPAKTEFPASAAPKSEKIPIDVAPGADARLYWDKYFSAHTPKPAAIRDAVRRLMKDKKYDHVIALIDSALRHRQAQPWMYEAMSLAMQAAGRPKEEIERAVMSALDFCDNTVDLTYIGRYLMQLGSNERALDLFRQAAQQDPMRPEPYMLGLKAARELNDLDALRWASLGIVNQSWPKDQAQVWQSGMGVANEVLKRLKTENRDKEAQEFQAELDRAMVRDCVAVVYWTGEADVDLMVQEPSGTVCSLRNPRTTAGGIMLGDVLSQTESDNSGGHSEVYVCPQGFDGTYRLKAWRVWGKVNTGKVRVEVTTHFRDKNPITVSKILPLEKDEVMVVFDLKDGRRKESLRRQQIANAADGQLAVNQQILAQQIAAAIDPGAMSSLALDRGYTTGGSADEAAGGAGAKFMPFAPRGAVGYYPQITWLSAGTMFSATAVISADRRYVRVSCSPIFSGIGNVATFNTTSGAVNNITSSSGGNNSSGGSGGNSNSNSSSSSSSSGSGVF